MDDDFGSHLVDDADDDDEVDKVAEVDSDDSSDDDEEDEDDSDGDLVLINLSYYPDVRVNCLMC